MIKDRLAKTLATAVRGQPYFVVAVSFGFVFIEESSAPRPVKTTEF